jgi:hypothetical protein
LRERPAAPSITTRRAADARSHASLSRKDPALRFQSVDEFSAALGEASASLASDEAT